MTTKKFTIRAIALHAICLINILLFPLFGIGQSANVNFITSWSEAQEESKSTEKPIFLDAFTTWCKPCQFMDKKIFTQKEVADFLNENFIPVKLDMDKPKNAGVKTTYAIESYPTFLFLSPDGRVLHKDCGISLSEDYTWFIKECRKALDDDRNLRSIINNFCNGPKDMDAHIEYVSKIRRNCYTDTAANAYLLKNLETGHLYNQKVIYYLEDIPLSLESNIFKTIVRYRKDLSSFHENNSVKRLILNKYKERLNECIKRENWSNYRNYRNEIDSLYAGSLPDNFLNLDVRVYEKKGEWTNFVKTVDSIFSMDALSLPMANNYSYIVYENVDDPELLNRAIKWIEKEVQQSDDYYYLDTYSALLFKLGEPEKANAIAKKAIAIAKREGIDYQATTELLMKYKK